MDRCCAPTRWAVSALAAKRPAAQGLLRSLEFPSLATAPLIFLTGLDCAPGSRAEARAEQRRPEPHGCGVCARRAAACAGGQGLRSERTAAQPQRGPKHALWPSRWPDQGAEHILLVAA